MAEVNELRSETANLGLVSSELSVARGDLVGMNSRLAEVQAELSAAKAEIEDAKLRNEALEKQVGDFMPLRLSFTWQ